MKNKKYYAIQDTQKKYFAGVNCDNFEKFYNDLRCAVKFPSKDIAQIFIDIYDIHGKIIPFPDKEELPRDNRMGWYD